MWLLEDILLLCFLFKFVLGEKLVSYDSCFLTSVARFLKSTCRNKKDFF